MFEKFYVWCIIVWKKKYMYIFDSDLVWRIHLKIKILCCVCTEFLTFNAYLSTSSYQIWDRPENERLKPVFENKITFWIWVLVLWILKGYYLVKMWNVRIKAFWYT